MTVHFSKLKALALICICAFLLSGCALKIAYNQLDWLIPWYFNNYFDLEGEQRDMMKEIVDRQLAWHRASELPRYAQYLQESAIYIQDGFTKEELLIQNEKLQRMYDDLMQHIIPDAVMLMSTLSERQLQHLYGKLNENLEEYIEDYIEVGDEKVRKQHAKDTRRIFKFFVGSVTDEQEEMINHWSKSEYISMEEDFLEYQKRWQAKYKMALEKRADKKQLEQQFEILFKEPKSLWGPDYQEKVDQNTDISQNLFIKLDETLTQKQRDKLLKKLNAYAEEFLELSRES